MLHENNLIERQDPVGPWVYYRLFQPNEKAWSIVESYLARLQPRSRPAAASACRIIAAILGCADPRMLNFEKASPDAVASLCAILSDERSPGYRRRLQSVLAGLVRSSWRLGHIDAETRDRLLDAIPPVQGESSPPGLSLSRHDIGHILNNPATTPREAAIMALGVGAGLRRQEMADLKCSDMQIYLREVMINVRYGKGGKHRQVQVNGRLAKILAQHHENQVEKWGAEVSFLGYTVDGISKACTRMSERIVISFSPHDLRRTFCTDALARGVPLHVVQQLMGHSSARTTVKYDRGQLEAMRKAAERLAF